MRRRSRTRRVLKWAGVATCALLAVALVVSLWSRSYVLQPGDRVVECDGKTVESVIDLHRGLEPGTRTAELKVIDSTGRERLVKVKLGGRSTGLAYLARTWLGVVLALAAAFTAFLWWRDRRVPAGHCQECGYDLTGNVSGRCPECGQRI